MPDWLRESWGYIATGAVAVAAVFRAIQVTLAAEKDRRALQNSRLETEKLELEVARLKNVDLERQKLTLEVSRLANSPEVVAERRVLYDCLRALVREFVRDARVEPEQIFALHEIRHDCIFRFPDAVDEALHALIGHCVRFYTTSRALNESQLHRSQDDRADIVHRNADALKAILDFEVGLPQRFKEYLRQ